MAHKLVMIFAFGMVGTVLPVLAADEPAAKGPKQAFEVSTTERFNFQPGGAIRLNNSYGYLTVEGWDEPEVEVTVTKSTDKFYETEKKAEAEKRLALIHVATELRSDKELSITTILASRHHNWAPPLPSTTTAGVTLEYRIFVPRDSKLIIHHRKGYIWVNDVSGDIEATSRTGDMTLMLPDPGPYSIDARARMGSVSSDFIGKAINQFMVGSRFTYPSQVPSHRMIHLRTGIGSITIKKGPRSSPFEKN